MVANALRLLDGAHPSPPPPLCSGASPAMQAMDYDGVEYARPRAFVVAAEGSVQEFTDTLAELTSRESPAEVRDARGGTLLHAAARTACSAKVHVLLEAAGQAATSRMAAAVDAYGRTAMWLAVHAGADAELLRVLADAGASVDQAAKDGWAPIHVAASRGDARALHALLLLGARSVPVDAPQVAAPGHGTLSSYSVPASPAILAAAGGHVDVLKVLVASETQRGSSVRLAVQGAACHAAAAGHLAALEYLGGAGAPLDECAHVAAAANRHGVLCWLARSAQVDLRAVDSNGFTALHLAARWAGVEVVELLRARP